MRFPSRKIRKVLFLYPPSRVFRKNLKYCQIPMGIAYLAGFVRASQRYEVQVLDATAEGYANNITCPDHPEFYRYGLSQERIAARLREIRPDVVGVACLFSTQWPSTRDTIRTIKAVDPDIITLTGGNHPTFMARECLAECAGDLDVIVLGEGEPTVLHLVDAIAAGEDLAAIDGIAYRDGDSFVSNPKVSFIKDIDELPMPARDLMPIDLYKSINMPHTVVSKVRGNTSLITSRGCPQKCTFCSSTFYWKGGYRRHSVDRVMAEIDESITRWGIREFNFEDDNATADRSRARRLFQAILDNGFHISLNTPNGTAIWTLDEKMLALMQRAGLQEIILAFESGVQEVLDDIIKKPLNLRKARDVVATVKALDIRHSAFFIIGFPGESRAQIDETLRFIKTLDLESVYLFGAMPLPGTPLLAKCEANGYLPPDFDLCNLTPNKTYISTPDFSAQEITRLVNRFGTRYAISLAWRSPRRFLRRYGSLLTKPGAVLELSKRVIQRLATT